jgi:hypothetical protein
VSHNGHDDIAARLRREASATAPDRLRADVMLRVRAEPRPQRIRPRRGVGRSFATVAAAACILGAFVFGASRVDFGGSSSSSSGGGSVAAGTTRAPAALGVGGKTASPSPSRAIGQSDALTRKAFGLPAVPAPLRAAIYGRVRLAPPLRHTFGALDPYHMRGRP